MHVHCRTLLQNLYKHFIVLKVFKGVSVSHICIPVSVWRCCVQVQGWGLESFLDFCCCCCFFFAFNLLVPAVRWWGRGRGMTGSLQVAVGGSQSSLLQSVHRIWPRSGKKPEPTSETEQREHLKHGWCHCRSSKEMYFPSPNPAETQHRGQPVRKTSPFKNGLVVTLLAQDLQIRSAVDSRHNRRLPALSASGQKHLI